MKIVVCDDESAFVDMIAEYCGRFEQDYQIPIVLMKYTRGKDVLAYYEKHKDIDIFILDIVMKEKNGLEVADALRKRGARGKIIFLTSMARYAIQGYEYGASRYWVKPLSYEMFSSTIRTLYQEIQDTSQEYLIEHIGTAIEKVYLDEILYIMTEGRKTKVQKTNGDYISNTRMSEYEEKLDDRFFRCHAAYIVNMEHILKIQGLEIRLSDGTTVFISKAKKKPFLKAFQEYLNDRSIKSFNMASV